jgi:hypothetical protein
MLKLPMALLILFIFLGCIQSQNQSEVNAPETTTISPKKVNQNLIDEAGQTLQTRFQLPEGFERTTLASGSFGEYLRNLPLKPAGTKVKYFDGDIKTSSHVYEAVVDMDLDPRDLQQCADAVIRLRAEYFYSQERYDEISFEFTNGFKADFKTWRRGNRISVDGNNVSWRPSSSANSSYKSFRRYLIMVFAYAGTYSVERETKKVDIKDIQVGDIFIKGGSPGHAVIVVDVAQNIETGEKIFMLAQSYMPAQDIQILQNPANGPGNPWYSNDFIRLETPEWTFESDALKRF